MVSAVILLVVEKSRINEVAEQLVELASITEVYSVAGQYDLVAVARVADNEAIATAVTNQMLKIEGITRTETLIATARGLPPRVAARGLRWESAVIVALAARLARRLRHGDPLASRVKLGKNDFAAAFLTGILARQQ